MAKYIDTENTNSHINLMVCEHFVMCQSALQCQVYFELIVGENNCLVFLQTLEGWDIQILYMDLQMGLYTWAHIYTNTYSCCFYWGIHHQDTNAPHAGIFVKATAKFLKNKFLIFFWSYHWSSVSVFTGAFTLGESFTGSCFILGNSTLV